MVITMAKVLTGKISHPGVAEGEVHGRGMGRGKVSAALGGFENRCDNFFEDNTRNSRGRGGRSDGETMDA